MNSITNSNYGSTTGVATGNQFVGERRRGVRARSAAVLVVGFLGLLVGLLRVHFDPATAYEVDIYRATPLGFWVGIGLAYLSFLVTVLGTRRWATIFLALLLGGLATTAIAALPLIRGYHFYGHSDPMTHLGWVKGIDAGTFDTLNFIYPGTHSLSAMVHQTTGLDVPFAMMFVVLCFTVTFLVFVPLIGYTLARDARVTACAGFSAFLLLPINNIATGFPYFPFLLATFFSPVIIYLYIKHLTVSPISGGSVLDRFRYLPTSMVFPIASVAVLLFHPQATMDLIALFVTPIMLQLFVRWRYPSHPLGDTRIMLGQAVFFVAIFYLWSSNQGAATQTVDQVYSSLYEALIGSGDSEFAETAKSRGNSASQIGISLLELFARVFLVSAIYCAFSAIGVVAAFRDRDLFDGTDVPNIVAMFLVGGVALSVTSGLHAFGGVTSYLYRHVGMGMVLATILGTIGVTYVGTRTTDLFRSRGLEGVVTVLHVAAVSLAVCLLVLSLIAVHPSPFMLNPGSHHTEADMEGYETALTQRPDVKWDSDAAVWYGGIRSGPGRYYDGLGIDPPYERRIIWSGAVPNESLGNLQGFYRSKNDTITRRDHYLPISVYKRQKETEAYRGLRYTESGFEAVRDQPGVHLVYSNGDVSVYYVDVDVYNAATTVSTGVSGE
mgnify:CR=1 FL=1